MQHIVDNKKFLIALALFCLFMRQGRAQVSASSYDELQAAYLYNFGKYIEWPRREDVFVIGIYGEEIEFVNIVRSVLKNKRISGKEIQVRNVPSIEHCHGIHMLYIPETYSRITGVISDQTTHMNILLITEGDMIKKGAMISFVVEEDRLRFKIKNQALESAGLVASEGLLNLAIQL